MAASRFFDFLHEEVRHRLDQATAETLVAELTAKAEAAGGDAT